MEVTTHEGEGGLLAHPACSWGTVVFSIVKTGLLGRRLSGNMGLCDQRTWDYVIRRICIKFPL